mmetsp:Transcript_25761/g.29503  ORF Transcript_25761/g.29503 Transcript_25761/m.29503 type:complete len:111 (-) Transcript_25761:349-681(-)
MFSKITSTLLLLVLLACITSVTEGTLRGTIQNGIVNDRLLKQKKKNGAAGNAKKDGSKNPNKGGQGVTTPKKNNQGVKNPKPDKKANNGGETKKKKKEVEKAKNAGREMP